MSLKVFIITYLLEKTFQFNTILLFVDQYINYDFIFHFENKTIQEFMVNSKLESAITSTKWLMINYDVQSEGVDYRGNKVVHMVFLNDLRRFENYSCDVPNVTYEDVVVFMLTGPVRIDDKMDDIVNSCVNRSGSVILYVADSNIMYHLNFYDGETSTKPILIDREHHYNLQKYINRFDDFRGYEFQIAYYPLKPYIWYEKHALQGVEANILKALSVHLNFSYVLRNFEGTYAAWASMIEAVSFIVFGTQIN